MLKLAFVYQEKLQSEWQKVIFEPKFKFYNDGGSWDYNVFIEDNSREKIQMVSVDHNDNVIGYFSASIARSANMVYALGAVNFGNVNIVFSRDLYQFIVDLFTKHHFRKIEWIVVVGNPAEKMYDKFISKHGGRIVGVKRESTKTEDGILRDIKEYELFTQEFGEKGARHEKIRKTN